MSKYRVLVALLAALSVSACASAPFKKESAVAKFDTGPFALSQNPKMLGQLNQTFTTNEEELESIAQRIQAGQAGIVEDDEEESNSTPSTDSLL